MMTPYDKLKSIENGKNYMKSDINFEILEKVALDQFQTHLSIVKILVISAVQGELAVVNNLTSNNWRVIKNG